MEVVICMKFGWYFVVVFSVDLEKIIVCLGGEGYYIMVIFIDIFLEWEGLISYE